MKKILLLVSLLFVGKFYAQEHVKNENNPKLSGSVETIKDFVKLHLSQILSISSLWCAYGTLDSLREGDKKMVSLGMMLASYASYRGAQWSIESLSKKEYKELGKLFQQIGIVEVSLIIAYDIKTNIYDMMPSTHSSVL